MKVDTLISGKFFMNNKFYFQSIIIILILIIINLNIPPFGITIGTSILIPICLSYLGNNLRINIHNKIICILTCYLIARTIDWFFAPGTHDIQSISLYYALSIISSGVILFIFLKNKIKFTERNLFIITLICILPYLQIFILKTFFNNHLNTTNSILFKFLL